jgi:tRNA pseudouridine65 synthase
LEDASDGKFDEIDSKDEAIDPSEVESKLASIAADDEALIEESKASARVTFEILYRDKDIVAIDKPPGFHVHKPEDRRRRISRDLICLHNLRDQINEYVYPVHRLDVGTDGVLLFALNKDAARSLSIQFQNGLVKKTYFAIARGWSKPDGVIDIPLELDSTNVPVPALTRYQTHQKVELPFAVGKRHASARYSLVEVKPETGRFHQIRRHLARLSHPLVGDTVHGDSHHNRFFRTQLELPGLWLKAKEMEFQHPTSGATVKIQSSWSGRWLRLFEKLEMEIP